LVFAYDGSELAKLAIAKAGDLLGGGRDALVATVWQPFNVGFVPVGPVQFDTQEIATVREAAEATAAAGAALAEAAGFRAEPVVLEGSPAWRLIVDLADERDSALIVLGSHGRSGLSEAMVGSVAGAVASHSGRTVMIAHRAS
jgi:nucleotide-binding universal stress UspA family protein